jgi:hypothetical protein
MSEFVDYCNICGFALMQHEVAGDISGTYINYVEHRNGSIQLSLCVDCQNKILEIIEGGADKAINRRLEIEGQIKVPPHKKRSYDKDDDDGSGGIRPALPPS